MVIIGLLFRQKPKWPSLLLDILSTAKERIMRVYLPPDKGIFFNLEKKENFTTYT